MASSVATPAEIYYLQFLLSPVAINYLSTRLKVSPVQGKLKFPYSACMIAETVASVPKEIQEIGVDADLLIFVTAERKQDTTWDAWAAQCDNGWNDITNRIQVAQINFNLNHYWMEDYMFEYSINMLIHKLVHVLAVGHRNFVRFIDPETNEIKENSIETKEINGTLRKVLKTSKIIEKAKEHFGCGSITGVLLEEYDKVTDMKIEGDHFEKTLFNTEIMNPEPTKLNEKLSIFSLAVMEDSGWFQVDYSLAEPFTWGKNKGCDFYNNACQSQENSFSEFCQSGEETGCIDNNRFKGTCSANVFMGDCVPVSVTNRDTDDCFNGEILNEFNAKNYAEQYGATSKCFMSKVKPINQLLDSKFKAVCYKYKCYDSYVQVTIGNSLVNCFSQGEIVQLPSFADAQYQGEIKCPNFEEVCGYSPKRCPNYCSLRGYCANGACECVAPWYGSDCSCNSQLNQIQHCGQCIDSTCIECEEDYYLYDQQCFVSCSAISYDGISFWLDSEMKKCIPCNESLPNCKHCTSGNKCLECIIPELLDEATSTCKCSADQYVQQAGATFSCVACSDVDANCDKCDELNGAFVCTQCISPYSWNELSSQCQSCSDIHEKCIKCDILSQTCNQCESEWFVELESKGCVNECSNGQTSVDGIKCFDCQTSFGEQCLQCNRDICLECTEGTYLRKDSSGCIVSCSLEENTYLNGNQCMECGDIITKCLNCQNKEICLQCEAGYYLSSTMSRCLQGSCAEESDTWTDETNKKCIKCRATMNYCEKCVSPSQCTDCADGYVLHPLGISCVVECPAQTAELEFVFLDEGQKKCLLCKNEFENCVECESFQGCKICAEDYYIYDFKCVTDCQLENQSRLFFLKYNVLKAHVNSIQNEIKTCSECSAFMENCYLCESTTKCVQCQDSYLDIENFVCVESCPTPYQVIADETTCQYCEGKYAGCAECSEEKCFICKEGLLMSADWSQCVADCQTIKEYKMTESQCKECPENCDTCDSDAICTSCISPYFLKDGTSCVLVCSEQNELFGNPETNVCEQCDSKYGYCLSCNANECLSCQENEPAYKIAYDLQSCVDNCADSGEIDVEGKCVKCSSQVENCLSCEQEEETIKCLECIDKYTWNEESQKCLVSLECEEGQAVSQDLTVCLDKCDDGYWKDANDQNICKECPDICSTCSDFETCTGCEQDYYLHNDKCETECPKTHFKSEGTCKNCNEKTDFCEECDQETGQCEKCIAEKWLYTDYSCVGDCQELAQETVFYFDSETGICYVCEELIGNCIDCSSKTVCGECATGYYKDEEGLCKSCGSALDYCSTCSSAWYCSACNEGSYYYDPVNGKCNEEGSEDACPWGYFKDTENIQCAKCSTIAEFQYCSSCTKEECTSCCDQKLILESNCTICQTGYFFNEEKIKCELCSEYLLKCFKCENSEVCLECAANYLNPLTGQCTGTCPEQYFKDYELNECVLCKTKIPGCQNCENSEICLSCFENYLNPVTKTCDLECEVGYFADSETHKCVLCSSVLEHCQECSSADECTSCDNSKLEEGKCYGCEKGEYFDEGEDKCEECDEECATCNGSGNAACTSCKVHFYLRDQQCVECDDHCENCVSSSANSCSSCSLPSHLNNEEVPNYCCDEKCLTCFSYTEKSCLSCSSNYVYFSNECLEECPDGYYTLENANYCRICSSNCKTCEVTASKCISCVDNKYLDNSNVCNNCGKNCDKCDVIDICLQCSEGYVDYGNGICDCKEICKTCKIDEASEEKAEVCLSCWDGYYYTESEGTCTKCVDYCEKCMDGESCLQCADGSYQDEETTLCVECNENCGTCVGPNEDNCTSCEDGKFLVESTSKCQLKCPELFFGNMENNKCESCFSNCLTCYDGSSQGCYTCIEGYHLNDPEATGVQYCCHNTCNTCSGPQENNCLDCAIEHYLFSYNNSCLTDCPPHYFGEDETLCCKQCHLKCKECNGAEENQCTDCYEGTYLIDGECKCHDDCLTCNGPLSTNCVSCNSGDFLTEESGCEECGIQCQTCVNNADYCNSCAEDYYYFEHACLEECPDHYYKNDRLYACSPCHSTCLQCSGPNRYQCTVCDGENEPVRHLNNEDGEPDYCCLANCKTCIGIYYFNCLSCYAETYLYNYQCLAECPAGYYEDANTNTCELCSDDCKTCEELATKCTSCYSGVVLFEETNECKCDDSCKTCNGKTEADCLTCYDKHYFDDSHCYPCNDECWSCANSADNCLSCEPGSEYYLYLNQCLTECPEQYFQNSDKQICDECHYSCKYCSGDRSSQCTECYDERLFYINDTTSAQYCCHSDCLRCKGPTKYQCLACKENYLYNGECITSCPDYYYDFKDDKICILCHETCRSCKNGTETGCTVCDDGLVLTMLEGDNAGTCSCEGNCQSCEGETSNCTSCKQGTFLENNKCVEECETGYYGDEGTRECKECVIVGCLDCSSATQCDECDENHHANPDTDSSVPCCSIECETCTETPTKCVTCSSDYYHYNDECVSEQDCNDKQGHYAVNKTNEGICDECHPTCDSCTGSAFNECDGCQPPRMLFNGICCDQSCKECSSPYGNDCLACYDDAYLLDSTCVEECPPYRSQQYYRQYYYQNEEEKKCEPCIIHCSKCLGSGDTECEECEVGYYLTEGHCEECSKQCEGCSTEGDDKCISCEPPKVLSADAESETGGYCCYSRCKLCSGPGTAECVECIEGQVLQDGVCKETCDSGHFAREGKCLDCDVGCQECDGEFADNCTECEAPSHLVNGFCCDVSCSECSNYTDDSCISCAGELLFLEDNSSCLEECPVGYYLESNECKSCVQALGEDCLECEDAANCTKCDSGIIDNGKCVSSCQPEQYYNESELLCKPCEILFGEECGECRDDQSGCVKCVDEHYLELDEQGCVQECSEESYPDASDMKCKDCSEALDNCEKCERGTECKECAEGHYLDQESHLCVGECPEGQIVSKSAEKECAFCSVVYDEHCEDCNESECTKCSDGLYVSGEECTSDCPAGTYKNAETMFCEACSEECKTCDSQKDNCTSCEGQLYYYESENECVEECPEGFFEEEEGNACRECGDAIPGCQLCENGDQCEQCVEQTYLDPITKKCESECPPGYYENAADYQCILCTEKFGEECVDCDINECSECDAPLVLSLDKKECITEDECTTENANWVDSAGSASCTPCIETIGDCEQCSSGAECLKCVDGKYLSSDGTECLEDCADQSGTWQDDAEEKCVKCGDSLGEDCLECESGEVCLDCETGVLRDGKCVQPCDPQNYYNESTEQCQPCSEVFGEECSECYANGEACTKCSDGTYLASDQQECVEECSVTTYEDNSAMECKECWEAMGNCEECSNSSECLKCKEGTYLDYASKQCVSSCGKGQFKSKENEGECDLCSNEYGSQCLECSGDKCTGCSDGLYASESGCANSCPSGTFRNSVSMLCEECSSNCKDCDYSGDYCTECESPAFLTANNKCKTCSSGTFHDSSDSDDPDKCSPCGEHCLECTSASNCKNCEGEYWITGEGSCVTEFDCPEDEYIDEENKACRKCQSGYQVNSSRTGCSKISCGTLCELCVNSSYCSECKSGNETNITLDTESGECIDWNDIADIDCSSLERFDLESNTQNLSNLTMEDILCYSQKMHASYHGESKWICNKSENCQNEGKCHGRSTQSCTCLDTLWGQQCEFLNFTLMQQNLRDIIGLIEANSQSSWMRYQLIFAKSLQYLTQLRNVWNEELILTVLSSMEKMVNVIAKDNYFQISEILVNVVGQEMSIIIEDGNLQETSQNLNSSISSEEQLTAIFSRIQKLVDQIAMRQMLSLDDEQNSNLMVTPEIEVFVLYIDKNTKADETVNTTDENNSTVRRRLFSLSSINKTEASQYISFSSDSIEYFNNVIDVYQQDFFIKVIAYQSNKFTQTFLEELNFKTGVTTFTIYKGQTGLLETVQMQPINDPIMLYIKKTSSEKFNEDWNCFAFDNNNTVNKTGHAVYMNSEEYVSCELFYLRNDFSQFSVAVEIGQKADEGLPLWALLVIIFGSLLILAMLLIFLLRNKRFREMLRNCCKKKPLNAKLDDSGSNNPLNKEEDNHNFDSQQLVNIDLDPEQHSQIEQEQQQNIDEIPNAMVIPLSKKPGKGGNDWNDADPLNDPDSKIPINRIDQMVQLPESSDANPLDLNAIPTAIKLPKNKKPNGSDADDVDIIKGKPSQKNVILPPVYRPKDLNDSDAEQLQDNPNIKVKLHNKENPNNYEPGDADPLNEKQKVFKYNKNRNYQNNDDGSDVDQYNDPNDELQMNKNRRKGGRNQNNDGSDVDQYNNPNDELQINKNRRKGGRNRDNDGNIEEYDNDINININLNRMGDQGIVPSEDVPEINSNNNNNNDKLNLNFKINQQKNNLVDGTENIPLENGGELKIFDNIRQQTSHDDINENDILNLSGMQFNEDYLPEHKNQNQRNNNNINEQDNPEIIDSTLINLNFAQQRLSPGGKNDKEQQNMEQMFLQEADENNIQAQFLQFPDEFELDERDDIENLATNIFRMYKNKTGQMNTEGIEIEEIKNEILTFFQMASMGEIDAFQNIDFNHLEQIDQNLFRKMCSYLNLHVFQKQKKQEMLPDNEVEDNQEMEDMQVQLSNVPIYHFHAEDKLQSTQVIQALQSQNFHDFCQSQDFVNLENIQSIKKQESQVYEQQWQSSKKQSNVSPIEQSIQQVQQQSQKIANNNDEQQPQQIMDQDNEQLMQSSRNIGPQAQRLMGNFYSKLLTSLQLKDQERKTKNSSVFNKLPPKQQQKLAQNIDQYSQNFIKSGGNPFQSQMKSQMKYQVQEPIISEKDEDDELLKNIPQLKQEAGLNSQMLRHKNDPYHQKPLVHTGLKSANQERFLLSQNIATESKLNKKGFK